MSEQPDLNLDPSYVADLFNRNSATYDRINTVLTFGLDAAWRRWAAGQAAPRPVVRPPSGPPRRPRVLDACAGTGLLARDLARRGADVTAADAAADMLAVAEARLGVEGLPLRTVVADLSEAGVAPQLGGPFDAVTLGFGLRYFADPAALLAPLRQVLDRDGRVVIVEAVRPAGELLGVPAGLYFFHVAPRIGAALAGRAELYDFLTASTRALGTAGDIAAHLARAGFTVVARRRFAMGVVAGFVATPSDPTATPSDPSATPSDPSATASDPSAS
jgi:demethylmenaquinone methyltransferase/2-methoxy-6-polyprenyl-1,4-benzoquinol methylase